MAKDASYEDSWRWIELQVSDAETRLLLTKKSNDNGSDKPKLVLVVDNVSDSYKALKEKGVTFTQEPKSAPWNKDQKFTLLSDTEDNTVMIGSE